MLWNIIDYRGNRHRWAKVHASVEATSHDNPASGADQIPPPSAETEVVYAERKGISVHDAVNWANSQDCPVTLYLNDDLGLPRPSSDELDAAARILEGFARRNGWWPSSTPCFDDMDAARKADLRFVIEGMLLAAASVRGQQAT